MSKITIRRQPQKVSDSIAVGDTGDMIQPFRAGETLNWQMVEST